MPEKRFVITVVAALLVGWPLRVTAQTDQEKIQVLQEQVATLTAALNAALKGQSVPTSSPRLDAIAALRAVDSALNGGVSFVEFKKYHVAAKIKVDALPVTPENAEVRYVAQVYTDMAHLPPDNNWPEEQIHDLVTRYPRVRIPKTDLGKPMFKLVLNLLAEEASTSLKRVN